MSNSDEAIVRVEVTLPSGERFAHEQRVSLREFGAAFSPLPPMHDLPQAGSTLMPDVFHRVADEQMQVAEKIRQDRSRFAETMWPVFREMLSFVFSKRDPVKGVRR